MGWRFGDGHWPELIAERLFETQVFPVAAPDLLRRGAISPGALDRTVLLVTHDNRIFGFGDDTSLVVIAAGGPGPRARHRPMSFVPDRHAIERAIDRIWDVGERRPLGVSNAGIAILSGMQTDTVRGVLAKNRSRFSRYGISTEAILQEVAIALAKGFAARARSLTPGSGAVSVVIRSSGAAYGALTITPISRRLSPERIVEIAARLRMHAEAIESELRKPAASRSARK